MPRTRMFRCLTLISTLPCLWACTVEHRAELVNSSDRDITARIVLEESMRDRKTLEEAIVPAGRIKEFEPVKATVLDKIRLEIEAEPGLPAMRQRIDFGDNRFELTNRGEFGDYGGGLRLRRVGSE